MGATHCPGPGNAFHHRVTIPHGRWTPRPATRRLSYSQTGEVFRDWLSSDAAEGLYDWFSNLDGIHVCFTHADTAFAFKMRFG